MRFGYLLPRLIIVAGIWAFFAFAFDPLLRWSVVASGQAMTGAKVDVDGLDTTFFPPSFEMRNVAVANPSDPMTNLVRFDRFRFAVWGRPLLRRKLVVEEGLLTGVEFGTPRETSGELPEVEVAAGTASDWDLGLDGYFDTISGQAADLGSAWLDDLVDRIKLELDPGQLASVQFVGSLKEMWTTRLKELETRIRGIEAKLHALKDGIDATGKDPLERVRAFREAYEEAQRLMAEAKNIRTELEGLGTAARGDLAKLQAVREQDLATIKSKADLLKLDGQQITESVLGPTVTTQLNTAGEWLAWAGKYASAFSTPTPQRLRGEDFTFPRPEDDLPTFLVKKLKVGGRLHFGEKPTPFRAIVTDITSEPRRLDRPMMVKLVSEGDAIVRVEGMFDQRPDVPIRDITITYAYPHPTEFVFGKEGDKLRVGVTAARTDWKARIRIQGDSVVGRVHFEQSPVTVVSRAADGIEEQVSRVIAASVGKVRNLTAEVTIGGTFDAPEWSVDSNLGPQIADGLESFVASEFEARKAELLAKAEAVIEERTSELRAKLDGRFRDVLAELDLEELNAQRLVQRLAGDRFDPNRLGEILPTGLEEKLGAGALGEKLGGTLGEKLGGDNLGGAVQEKLDTAVGEKLDPKKVTERLDEALDPEKIGLGKNPFDRFRRK